MWYKLAKASSKFFAALMLAVLLPLTACAYIIVMRGGRRIEIPATFIVTSTALTYEAAPGINITLLMTGINIPATERANDEPAGSFLKRAQGAPSGVSSDTSTTSAAPQARRTLTNKDLEASRRAREQSEIDYERRRVELGLPSLDEARRRNAEEAQQARAQLRQGERNEAEAEAYWRSRANALRAEIAAVSAEANYLRGQLAEESDYLATPSYTTVTTIVPTPFPLHPRHPLPQTFPQPVLTGNPGFIYAGNTGAQFSGQFGFGGGLTRAQVFLNARTGFHTLSSPVIIGQGIFAPPLTAYSAGPFANSYYPSYERAALVARLRELEATRAGLQARWRVLEDEARRAGAFPGWLRP